MLARRAYRSLRFTAALAAFGIAFGFLVRGAGLAGAPMQLAQVLFYALLSLAALAAAVKRRMETGWLRRTVLEEGARNAFVTLAGYAGAALAVAGRDPHLRGGIDPGFRAETEAAAPDPRTGSAPPPPAAN